MKIVRANEGAPLPRHADPRSGAGSDGDFDFSILVTGGPQGLALDFSTLFILELCEGQQLSVSSCASLS